MIHSLISTSSNQCRRAARDWLLDVPGDAEVLLIASEREAADEFAWALAAERGATFGIHRFSLAGLATVLAMPVLADRGSAPATALGAQAVATRAAFEAKGEDLLPQLAAVIDFPGFPRALAGTLGELRRAGIDGSAVRGGGLADLAAIAERFDRELVASRISDTTAFHAAAIEALARSPLAAAGVPILLLDVAVRERHERRFLEALVAGRERVLWTMASGDDRSRDTAVALGFEPLSSLPLDIDPLRSGPFASAHADSPPLARLREFVFSDATPPPGDPGDAVQFFSAPGEARECVEIVRRVLDHARAETAFDAMAVFVRAPDLYTPHLESAFRRAGVPAFFARGTLRPDPSGRAFLALLACRAESLSAKRFAEYLSFAQVPDLDEAGAPPVKALWVAPRDETLGPAAAPEAVGSQLSLFEAAPSTDAGDAFDDRPSIAPDASDPAQDSIRPHLEGTLRAPWKWEEYLVEAAVIGGRDRWKRRLDGLEAELHRQRAALAAAEPDSPRLPGIERDLEQLGYLKRFALPVIDALAALPASAAWGAWLDALSSLAPRVLRRPERVLQVIAEMRSMAGVGPVGIDEVRAVLNTRLRLLEQDPPARRFGRVFVGTPDQARGRSFEVVFVPGLAERLFPQRPREDPLLLDERRRALDRGLDTQDDRAQRERLLLRLAIGAATRRVVLSYPRMEVAEARPRVPSFYGLDLMRAARGALPGYETLERDAAAAGESRLAWPAPHDPARAIDPIEHDLAVLGSLLEGGESTRGRGRYLLDLSEPLRRSLTARYRRWRPRWSPEDGLVRSTPELEPILAQHRPNHRAYSATGLQRFATCPYQFLLASIHRLEPRRETVPLIQMDPLTRGSLFHEIQAATLTELNAAGALPITPDRLGGAIETLDRVTERHAARWCEDVAPAIPRVWDDEVRAMRADLRVWLRRLSDDAGAWIPIHFELAFGLGARSGQADARPDPVTLEGGWMLHGAIDLIERSVDGSMLRITDHKTGRKNVRTGCRIGGGEVLQPVLYSLAAEVMLGVTPKEGRLFFCTARGGYEIHPVPIDPFARLDARHVYETVDAAIVNGALPPAPRREACAWCDFRPVCGPHEERRIRGKRGTLLDPLIELRKSP
jgi:ATP-dependent helicase/nuclease subunit B